MTIKDLQPSVVWNNFYLLTRCPRPSKHEEVVRKFLLDWAAEHDVEAFTDDTGNVIMRVPATPGYEHLKTVVLQGHMDMVPQKNADVKHDFIKDPIETKVDGDCGTCNNPCHNSTNTLDITTPLSEMKQGEKGSISHLSSEDASVVRKLISMGFVPGREVELSATVSDKGARIIKIGEIFK